MTHPAHHVTFSFGEYLALEEVSNVKHELLDGHIYAMAGGTPEHAALAASVSGHLFAQLGTRRCRVYDSNLRVRVPATGLATYPDVTVIGGPRVCDPNDRNTVVNPTVIVEVLSRHTEKYDRGEKFDHYRQIVSLREYVLVSHHERLIEVRRRIDQGWKDEIARSGDVVTLSSIGCTFEVSVVHDAAIEPA